MKKMGVKIFVLCFLFLFFSGAIGVAADYPNGPIKIIYPYAQSGSGSELLWRFLQQPLEKELGQRVLLEAVPGGSTKVGTVKAIKAEPDGYTLLFTADATWVPRVYSGIFEVGPWEQLVPMGKFAAESWLTFEVLIDSPYKTWADVVRLGKKKDQITMGTAGTGGLPDIVIKEINKKFGLNIVAVPFEGSGGNKVALLGGHIDMRNGQPSECIDMIRAGKTRAIAVSAEKRVRDLPDTQTFIEAGIGGVYEMYRGFWAPLKTPSNAVNTFAKALEKAVQDPKFIKGAEDLQYRVEYRSPERQMADIKRSDAEWGPACRDFFKKP